MINGGLAGGARWVWRSRHPAAVVARAALLPAAALYRAATMLRTGAYDLGWLRARPLPVPSIGVGNLSVGGTGKTPIAGWLAGELQRRGMVPGIVLRGYGGDEAHEHRAHNPRAVVEADPDRMAAAARAVVRGAQVLVLDDCLQHRAVAPTAMLALVSADGWDEVRWPLPAGPWREGLAALARADLVVVTRKVVGREQASALAARLAERTRGRKSAVAALEPVALRAAHDAATRPLESLRGCDVVVVAGVGEPELVAAQVARTGAAVRLVAPGDHFAYSANDAASIAASVPPGGVAVTTAKDAVKLATLWPAGGAELLVLELGVRIESGAPTLDDLLTRLVSARQHTRTPGAATLSPARDS